MTAIVGPPASAVEPAVPPVIVTRAHLLIAYRGRQEVGRATRSRSQHCAWIGWLVQCGDGYLVVDTVTAARATLAELAGSTQPAAGVGGAR